MLLLEVRIVETFPSESDDGNDDGTEDDELREYAAVGACYEVVEEPGRRNADNFRETEHLGAIGPESQGSDCKRNKREKVERTAPGEYHVYKAGHAEQRRAAFPFEPFPVFDFQEQHVSRNLHEHVKEPARRAEQEKLKSVEHVGYGLGDEQTFIRFDLK